MVKKSKIDRNKFSDEQEIFMRLLERTADIQKKVNLIANKIRFNGKKINRK